jgi:type II secretory ATPase GspE/PulE/Tfp pilus assembly ATPase PilB-like protein
VSSAAKVISLIKLMAKMNIAERRLPQDDRIQLRAQGKLVDLRVATMPTVHGESLVLRILDKESVALDLDQLGFEAEIANRLKRSLLTAQGTAGCIDSPGCPGSGWGAGHHRRIPAQTARHQHAGAELSTGRYFE